MSTVAHPRIEPSEFCALQADSGWRLAVELIDGQAVVMPPTGGAAASVQGELFFALRSWQEATADLGLLLQDVFVMLPGEQYLAPDIAWWSPERRPPLSEGAVNMVPDLVIEVLSPATRANDLGIKREVYVRSGAQELWLADPDARTVTRVRERAAYDEVLGHEGELRSELLPGFRAELARIFRR